MAMSLKLLLIAFFTVAAIPNQTKPSSVFPQCSTPSVVMKFKDMPRCSSGTACSTHADCPTGSCVANPITPTSVFVDVYSGEMKVVNNLQVVANAGQASFVLPRVATKLTPSNVTQGKNKMVVKWTTVCASNLLPCSSDANCPGSTCVKNSEQIDIGVKKVSGEAC